MDVNQGDIEGWVEDEEQWEQEPSTKPARKDGDPMPPAKPDDGSPPGITAIVDALKPVESPIQTNETPIVTNLTPAIGPRSGPAPEIPPTESSRTGLAGVELSGFAAIGYGGISAVEAGYALGINGSGNGGIGGAGSFGLVTNNEGVDGDGFGYPSAEGWGVGIATSAGIGGFASAAESYQQLQGPFETTIIATPILTFQKDSAIGDPSTSVIHWSGPSGLGVFHFQTTTPRWSTWDLSVTEPLNRY